MAVEPYDDQDPSNVKLVQGKDVPYTPVEDMWGERPYAVLGDLSAEDLERLGLSELVKNDDTGREPSVSEAEFSTEFTPGPLVVTTEEAHHITATYTDETPEGMRRKALDNALTLANGSLTALEKSVRWLAVDDDATAREYESLIGQLADYRERLAARHQRQR